MRKKEPINLSQEIEEISSFFEDNAWTENIKLLKIDFDINLINTPKHYLNVITELEEANRQARVLFLHSLFNIVCQEEGKLYYFEEKYQANMSYDAVMKKDDTFFIRDEDGDYKEIFTSEKFYQFIKQLYDELLD